MTLNDVNYFSDNILAAALMQQARAATNTKGNLSFKSKTVLSFNANQTNDTFMFIVNKYLIVSQSQHVQQRLPR